MSLEYLKNRSNILTVQEKEAEQRHINEINKIYFIEESVYDSAVHPAIRVGEDRGMFLRYEIKERGKIGIFLTDEPEDENLGSGHLLEIKQERGFLKLGLTHNINGMYSLNEIDMEKELYNKGGAIDTFLHTLDKLFESIDRQEDDD